MRRNLDAEFSGPKNKRIKDVLSTSSEQNRKNLRLGLALSVSTCLSPSLSFLSSWAFYPVKNCNGKKMCLVHLLPVVIRGRFTSDPKKSLRSRKVII